MRASHKKRIARLVATLEECEEEAFDERCLRRFEAFVCEDIREAMEWRGLDPASASELRNAEARGAKFVDNPEMRAADAAVLAAEQERSIAAGDDPGAELAAEVLCLVQNYLDGAQPDFRFASLMSLWAWALAQDGPGEQADGAIAADG